MRHFLDKQLKGHALLFDGPYDLIKHARKANEGNPKTLIKPYLMNIRWPGRVGNNWQQLSDFIHKPWPEGVAHVNRVIEGIKKHPLPTPKDIRRRPKWSDSEGQVDIDRALSGEMEMFRTHKRERVTGPFTISIITNLDLASNHTCNKSGVFYRSACAIALADILEELGYSVEIWTWTLGAEVYPEPYHFYFSACRPKKAGSPVDVDALCDTMSAWFTTTVLWGTMATNPDAEPRKDGGYPIEPPMDATTIDKVGMMGWEKYLDLEQGTIPVCIPLILGSFWGDGLSDGVSKSVIQARKVLEQIISFQGD